METLFDDDTFKDGIRKCVQNAESLIEDANLLKENARIARAYTLFQLAIEELGKSSVLYFFATLPDEDKKLNLKNFRKEFSSHKIKTGKAINFDALILMSIKDKKERMKFLNVSLNEHKSIDQFNNMKNYSLYTSLIDQQFLLPSEVITAKHLEEIENRAKVRLELIKPTMEFLLKGFDEVKHSPLKHDSEEIKKLADEFISDFLNGEA